MNFNRILRTKQTKKILDDLYVKKQTLLQKLDAKFEQKRSEMEKEALGKRITPEMKRKADKYFAMEENKQKRQLLIQEAFHDNYYRNAKLVAQKGAKLWEASSTLKPPSLSPKLIDLKGEWLDKSTKSLTARVATKKVSLVCVFFNQFGEENVATFISSFEKEFGQNENVGVFHININEQAMKSPLVKLLRPLLRFMMDKEKRSRYLCVDKNVSRERNSMGIENQVLGWVLLVDTNGLVRWRAHGFATPTELEHLNQLTHELLK